MTQLMTQPSKLLFLPGAGGNPSFWQPVADHLRHSASRRLLGWPGFGAVPADPSVQGMQDLVALVTQEIDQPTALIAQSMGGVIAIQAALQRPDLVTHIVLTVTSGGVDMSDLQAEDWRPAFFTANQNAPRWLADYRGNVSASLAAIRVPVLLIWGDADPISPVAVGLRLKQLLANSRMHVINGGQHDLANKHASSVAALIDDYLCIQITNPLARTLEAIEMERPKLRESFQRVDELLKFYGETNLAERLYADCGPSVDCSLMADLFSILIWSTSDNGHALTRTTERWLIECNDERKINIAINLDVYPFIEPTDMKKYLSIAAKKFPSATDKCNELLAEREN